MNEDCGENEMETKTRNSSLELLRIISILLIIFHHFSLYGNYIEYPFSGVRVMAEFLVIGGKIGTYCFILISGYFMCEKSFDFKRIIKIWFAAATYSLILGVALRSMGYVDGSLIEKMIKGLFPICTQQYWFITGYAGVYLLSPALNCFIDHMEKIQLKKVIAVVGVMFCIIPTIFVKYVPFGNVLAIFVVYYLIGGYLKKHCTQIPDKACGITFAASIFIIYAIQLFVAFLGMRISGLEHCTYWISGNYSFLIMTAAVSLFLLFLNAKPFYSSKINNIASTVIGIYLIHDNRDVRNVLWNRIVPTEWIGNQNVAVFLICAIFVVGIIFITGFVVEYCRIRLLENIIMKWKKLQKLCDKMNDLMNL